MFHIVGSTSYLSKRFLNNYSGKIPIRLLSNSNNNNNSRIDLCNPEIFNYNTIKKNDVVILFAAISSPEECEKNEKQAYAINVTGTKYFIEKCIKNCSRVLFFSSDAVYGNTLDFSDENTEASPFGNYAIMKREIEIYFEKINMVKIFRLSYIWSKLDKFTMYLDNCRKNKNTAEVYNSLFRNVIYIDDVTESIFNLLHTWEMWNNQIFNICGRELLSRFDIAELLKKKVYKDINYISTEPDKEFYLYRAKSICTKSIYLEKLLNRPAVLLKDAIEKEFNYC